MCTAAVSTYQGLYAQRFFLGFLESGVSPMFMLIVGGFYKKDEQALRMGAWYCATGEFTRAVMRRQVSVLWRVPLLICG